MLILLHFGFHTVLGTQISTRVYFITVIYSIKNTVREVKRIRKCVIHCSDCFGFLNNICVLKKYLVIHLVHKLVNPREVGGGAEENCS